MKKNEQADNPLTVKTEPPVPSEPYFRICAVGASDGTSKPKVEATAYLRGSSEWEDLTRTDYAHLKEYIERDKARRRQEKTNAANARKIVAAKAREDAARKEREELEHEAGVPTQTECDADAAGDEHGE